MTQLEQHTPADPDEEFAPPVVAVPGHSDMSLANSEAAKR